MASAALDRRQGSAGDHCGAENVRPAVVIDHMGRTDARAGTGTEGFQSLLRAVGEGWCWAKLSGAHRISQNAPDYPDARPFTRRW